MERSNPREKKAKERNCAANRFVGGVGSSFVLGM
jgi:hypothetical protein